MNYLQGHYLCSLNFSDKHDPELPLRKSKSFGGTMVLWRRELDPFIVVEDKPSASFLPVIFQPYDSSPSIHYSIYLPTAGKENEFLDSLSSLSSSIELLKSKYPGAPVYLRGNFNVSSKNQMRTDILNAFMILNELQEIPNSHLTYHHFTGNGSSYSNLDKL